MTKQEFVDLILSVSPNAKPFKGGGATNHTVFSYTKNLSLEADGRPVETGFLFYVERFTKNPDDPVVEQLTEVLTTHDDIATDIEETQYETDTGFFQFIWRCEVV